MNIFRIEKNPEEELLPPEGITFEVRIETDLNVVYKLLQKTLQIYKDEKKGPTLLAVQSTMDMKDLQRNIPLFLDFPQVQIHVQVSCSLTNSSKIVNDSLCLKLKKILILSIVRFL